MKDPKKNSKKMELYFSTLMNVSPKLSGQLSSAIRFSKIDIVSEIADTCVEVK